MMLADEYFSAENELFLETLRRVNQPKALAGLADRWKKDPRPWARRQIFAYLSQPLNSPGHQPIVKRLFKQAEEVADQELMAAFLVAFDRHVRRKVKTKYRWDRQTRTSIEEERLVTPRDVLPLKLQRALRNPMTGDLVSMPVRAQANARLFKYRTRYYLRRRVWRFFRRLGYRDAAAYVQAIGRALAAYEDADLQRGENILDSWGLMHACFGRHDALDFGPSHIRLKEGRGPGDLSPAPVFPDAWKKSEAASSLLSLAATARARLVRVWAMQLFQREHANFAVSLEDIVRLLDHEDAEVQQFGAKLIESSAALATLPVASWLKLLETKNDEALQRICDAFAKHVSGERLNLAQCVALASFQPVPVARLGQRYLKDRAVSSSEDRELVCALANAKCSAVAAELTSWALAILGKPEHYSADQTIRFFDSQLEATHDAAWSWLMTVSHALNDPALWSRLVETPYDDLRFRVIDYLQKCSPVQGLDAGNLEPVWRSVLLGVHRGGRQKSKAVRQIADAIVQDPARVGQLLPVLAVAVRSVRGPEARAGLAAVVSVVENCPQLAEAVRNALPEMKLEDAVA